MFKRSLVMIRVADIAVEVPSVSRGRAWDLIGQMIEAHRGTDLESFWSLCKLVWSPDGGDRAWLRAAVERIIPARCHPFLRALLTNDRDALAAESREISQFLSVVCAAPIGDRLSDLPVPEFLTGKEFEFDGVKCSGDIVWAALTGRAKAVRPLGMDWLAVFALHFWYGVEDTDLVSAFHTFYSGDIITSTHNDPMLSLLTCHCEGEGRYLDVSVCLPPVDGYVFEHLARVLSGGPEVGPASLMRCVQRLIEDGMWPQGVALLSWEGHEEKAQQLVTMFCSPGREVVDGERRLLDEVWYPREKLLEAKIAKLNYVMELSATKKEKIGKLEEAVDLNMELERWDDAHRLIFEEYIPLMTLLGMNSTKKVYVWCMVLIGHLDGDDERTDCFVIDAMRRVDAGEILREEEIEKIADVFRDRWGTFALRREICKELLNQPNAANYLQDVDACPKDRRLSLAKTCP